MVHAAILEGRSVIAVTGVEARDFLQGLTTNDMALCAPERALYAGLLTPQGKILFDFLVIERDGGFLIDCAGTAAPGLTKRLNLYRLRAKVQISPLPEFAVAAVWGGAEITSPPIYRDPRLAALGQRAIGPRQDVEKTIADFPGGDYSAHRLALGIPDSADLGSDTVLALDAGFEELNGVSFKKGCYVGQEVTARMKHRATARKRFLIVQFSGGPISAGAAVLANDLEIGTMATGNNDTALALVRLDRFDDAEKSGAAFSADGRAVSLRKPEWLHV